MGWQDCALNPVGCTVGNVAGEAAESTWESFTRWVAHGLTDLASTVFAAFSQSTSPDFTTGWFADYVDTLVIVSLPVLALFFVLQVIAGVVRREVGYLGRALVGVSVGAMGVPIALAVVDGLSSFVDAASAYLIRSHSPAGFQRLFEVGTLVAAGTGGGFVLVALFLAIFAMFALYLVLLLRKVALLAIVVFAPLALVGWTWQSTRSWLRRWVEVTAALLISKFAMAVVFSLGLTAIGRTGTQSSQGTAATIGDLLAGVVLLSIAAFAPWACFHFLHWAGAEAATAVHHATHRGSTTARQQAARAHQSMQQAVQRATSTTQSNGSSSPSGLNGGGAPGMRRATTPTGAPGPDSTAAASGRGAAAGGAGAGVAAGVQATHAVATGIKDAGEQAGSATQQHTARTTGSPAQTPAHPAEPPRGGSAAERATRPTPPPTGRDRSR